MRATKVLFLFAIFATLVFTGGLASADNFSGTYNITVVAPSGASITSLSVTGNTAYVFIKPATTFTGQYTTMATSYVTNFQMILPAIETIYVVAGSSTIMPTNISVSLEGIYKIDYTILVNATGSKTASTVTSIIPTVITTAVQITKTKTFFVMYPAFIMSPVQINFYETGYFMGLSIGYYTYSNGSEIYVPTIPIQRNIVLQWDPISSKIDNIAVTIVKTKVYPQQTVYYALSKTVTATNYATILETTIGQYTDVVIITKTGEGLNTSGYILSYHNGTIANSMIVFPNILADINSFFQVASYGEEQINWVNQGQYAVPNIVVPYKAIFLGRTYSGYMTIYYDDKGQEYINYVATYTFSTMGDIYMYVVGTMNINLTPGAFGGVLRSQSPLTTTYVTTTYETITTQITTTIVING